MLAWTTLNSLVAGTCRSPRRQPQRSDLHAPRIESMVGLAAALGGLDEVLGTEMFADAALQAPLATALPVYQPGPTMVTVG